MYFKFLKFIFYFLLVFKVLNRLIQKYLQSFYFFGRRIVCAQTAIFFNELVSKKCMNNTFYVWRIGWFGVFQTSAEYGCAAVRQNFPQIKVCQQIRRKDSIQAACRRMSRLLAILYLGAQNTKLFSKFKYKKSKI
jgi:hypothetical protein